MKELVKFEQQVGGDGAKAKGALGVEADQLKLELSATYPIAKIIDPAMEVVDDLIDKLERFIPGDQKSLAESLKADARKLLVAKLSEKPVIEAQAERA